MSTGMSTPPLKMSDVGAGTPHLSNIVKIRSKIQKVNPYLKKQQKPKNNEAKQNMEKQNHR